MSACVYKGVCRHIISEALDCYCNDEIALRRTERLCRFELYETSSSPRREQPNCFETDFKLYSWALSNHRCCAWSSAEKSSSCGHPRNSTLLTGSCITTAGTCFTAAAAHAAPTDSLQ